MQKFDTYMWSDFLGKTHFCNANCFRPIICDNLFLQKFFRTLDSLCPGSVVKLVPVKTTYERNNMNMTTQNQLELSLAGTNRCPRAMKRQVRANRANWWFGQMRQVVDRAFEWEPAPRFESEQILLTERQPRG